MIKFDSILDEIGVVTRPQRIQLFLLCFPAAMAAMHMAAMVFMGAPQEHICTMPLQDEIVQQCGLNWTASQTEKYIPWNQDDDSMDSCTRYIYNSVNCSYWTGDKFSNSSPPETEHCDSWIYDTSVFHTTLVSDYNLVCERRQQSRLSQAIFMLGVLLGCGIWGQSSDRFGRKKAVIAPQVIGLAFAIGAAYAQSIVMFTALRFFVGFTLFPSFNCAYVLGSESVKPNLRVWVGQSAQAVFAVGFCVLALLGYYVRDWRSLQLWISTPVAGIIILMWFLFESPRWLISSRRFEEANKIVKKLLKSGKILHSTEAKKLDTMSMTDTGQKESSGSREQSEEEHTDNIDPARKSSIIDVLKLPNMRRKSIILFYEWTVTSCAYYGLTLNAADLGGDPFLNLFLSAFVEIPASFLAILLLQKWGRRPTLVSTLCFSGIACTCMMFVPKDLIWLNITTSVLGKFAITATFGAVYIFATEIYPTPVRNVGLGVCSSWARLGGMLAPFVAMLDDIDFSLPYVVFGLLSLIGGALGLLLPEVRGIKLPETLEEGEEFGKHYSGLALLVCSNKEPDKVVKRSDCDEITENEVEAILGQKDTDMRV